MMNTVYDRSNAVKRKLEKVLLIRVPGSLVILSNYFNFIMPKQVGIKTLCITMNCHHHSASLSLATGYKSNLSLSCNLS